jgi:hypothetical protein
MLATAALGTARYSLVILKIRKCGAAFKSLLFLFIHPTIDYQGATLALAAQLPSPDNCVSPAFCLTLTDTETEAAIKKEPALLQRALNKTIHHPIKSKRLAT